MSCAAGSVGALEAIATSSLLTGLFVGVLYLPFNVGDRDSPKVVRSRLVSLVLLALASEVYVRARDPEIHNLASTGWFSGALAAGSLTGLLYLGPLLASAPSTQYHGWLAARNYFMAPLLEELVFRRHSLLLWRCVPHGARMFGPAALFSAAHAHHARSGIALSVVIIQLIYTLVFGLYSSALFAATNSLIPPLTAHVMCNFLGVPDLGAISAHPARGIISCVYAASIATFLLLFAPVLHRVSPVPTVL